jgi:hypothetical protein
MSKGKHSRHIKGVERVMSPGKKKSRSKYDSQGNPASGVQWRGEDEGGEADEEVSEEKQEVREAIGNLMTVSIAMGEAKGSSPDNSSSVDGKVDVNGEWLDFEEIKERYWDGYAIEVHELVERWVK